MARHRIKSYKGRSSRKRGRGGKKKKNTGRWALLLIVVIAAGIFVLNQSDDKPEPTQAQEREMSLEEVIGYTPGDDIDKSDGDKKDTDGTETGSDDWGSSESDGKDTIVKSVLPAGSGITSKAAKALIEQANSDIRNKKYIVARDKLNKLLLDMPLSRQDQMAVKTSLTKLADIWLFSKKHLAGDVLTNVYEVKSGDMVAVFCKKYKVPYQILLDINGVKKPSRLQTGDFKVINGPFHAVIDLSEFNMDLFLQDQYVKSYKVGIGKPGRETPTGKWRVKKGDKLEHPTWYDDESGKSYVADDPKNPLGSRWIGLEGLEGDAVGKTGYALHGTKEPESIGTKCSRGCIRLHEADIIEVYSMLTPVYSKVEIKE